jgi:Tol biopolymer transport system component
VRYGLRVFLPLSAALLVLVLSPAALGDETAYQLVVPPTNGTGCAGFPHEKIDGTVIGCTPDLTGAGPFGFFSVAADGSVVFASDEGGFGSIWLVHPDGTSVELDNSTWDYSPTISYDGSKVVFARYNAAESNGQADPALNVSDIYAVNSDGSDLHLVASGLGTQYLRVPSISPDGSTVAYWCGPGINGDTSSQGCGPLTDGSYRHSGVMRVNIDGSNERMIVIGPGDNLEPVGPTGFTWSPDSQWIAMDGLQTVDLGNGESTAQRQLFEYRTDGSDLFNNRDPSRQITNIAYDPNAVFPHTPEDPQFSPDGSQLLYVDPIDSNGNEANSTNLVGVDGSNPHQVFLNDGGYNYDAFIPTATPVAPPPLVDMTHITVPSVVGRPVGAENGASDRGHCDEHARIRQSDGWDGDQQLLVNSRRRCGRLAESERRGHRASHREGGTASEPRGQQGSAAAPPEPDCLPKWSGFRHGLLESEWHLVRVHVLAFLHLHRERDVDRDSVAGLEVCRLVGCVLRHRSLQHHNERCEVGHGELRPH